MQHIRKQAFDYFVTHDQNDKIFVSYQRDKDLVGVDLGY